MERKLILENKELLDSLNRKGEFLKEARGITKIIEEQEKKRLDLAIEIEKYKNEIFPLVRSLTDGDYDEFEAVTNVEINKEGKIEVTIIDVVEQFKVSYKESLVKHDEEVAKQKKAIKKVAKEALKESEDKSKILNKPPFSPANK